LKDALKLAAYFVAVILVGALVAPGLYWSAQSLANRGVLPALAGFDFEVFFHRALLVAAILLLLPMLRVIGVRRLGDLCLRKNPNRWSDFMRGFIAALVPLTVCAVALVLFHVFSVRGKVPWPPLGRTVAASIVVPWIEETFFRGLVLGILLRSGRKVLAVFLTSALFSVVHFLKAPEGTSAVVTWCSGFNSIAHSFEQFREPILVLAGFTTLFLIGWILADARLRTASLWLPIGLHTGWILGNGVFSRITRREMLLLPWLGRNLLIGLIPLGVLAITWFIVRFITREART
jgi:membrane protease YdiL (CAAX protease family)